MTKYPIYPLDPADEAARKGTIAVAGVSLAAAACILITLLVFPALMKNKIYLQLVFVATTCDLIATSMYSSVLTC